MDRVKVLKQRTEEWRLDNYYTCDVFLAEKLDANSNLTPPAGHESGLYLTDTIPDIMVNATLELELDKRYSILEDLASVKEHIQFNQEGIELVTASSHSVALFRTQCHLAVQRGETIPDHPTFLDFDEREDRARELLQAERDHVMSTPAWHRNESALFREWINMEEAPTQTSFSTNPHPFSQKMLELDHAPTWRESVDMYTENGPISLPCYIYLFLLCIVKVYRCLPSYIQLFSTM